LISEATRANGRRTSESPFGGDLLAAWLQTLLRDLHTLLPVLMTARCKYILTLGDTHSFLGHAIIIIPIACVIELLRGHISHTVPPG
jgi:hypothetical protein